jgi:hypothetical protein
MKNLILTVILLGVFYNFGHCQGPTLFNFNYVPKINETQVFIKVDTTGIIFDQTGANFTWDYSNLKTTTTKVYSVYFDPEPTPYISSFNNATLAAGAAGYYSYYYADTNKYEWLGSGSSSYVMVNTDPLKYCMFPFKYGDQMNDSMYATYTQSSVSHQYSGAISLFADGWGTLKLPKNTYSNVLRTKSQQYNKDTSDGIKTETYYTVICWYDGIHNIPLVRSLDSKKYTSGNPIPTINKTINIAEFTDIVSIPSFNNLQSVKIFPNPAQEELFVEINLKQNANVEIQLIDILGKLVRTIDSKVLGVGIGQNTIDISGLSKGIYTVKIITGQEVQFNRIVIQ